VVPVTTADDDQAGSHPILVGRKVTLRPGRPGDARKLRAILAEPSVSRWWAEPDPVEVIEAVRLLARFLFEQRGHHRITIDPAAANEPAIRCYAKVGFRPVGVMRQYERGPDGTFHDGLLMDLLRDELTPSPRKRPRG
jgi:hypothetical protein